MRISYIFKVVFSVFLIQITFLNSQAFANPVPLNYYFNTTLKGKVTTVHGEPLIGVSVTVKSSGLGTVTDAEGRFKIKANEDDFLIISMAEYVTKEVKITKTVDLEISLEENTGLSVEKTAIIGSRDQTRSKDDSPIAVDIIDLKDFVNQSGNVELNQILQYLAPSFNANRQTGADAADHVDPSSFRGLGPDQILFLVNGKRYHPSALINVFGSRGRGNAGTDLNSIPASAVDHIEILRDGAAAQYGSDAVAGVINVVLKSQIEGTTANVNYGANATGWGSSLNYEGYNGKIMPKAVDGNTLNASLSHGFKLGNKGFLGLTADYLSKEKTLRPNNSDLFESYRNGAGNASLSNTSLFFNGKYRLGKGEVYVFGGYSFRKTDMFNWNIPIDDPTRNVYEIFPEGYNPHLASDISNYTASVGYKTKFGEWNADISHTTGKNNVHLYTTNTLNPSLLTKSPTNFDNGGYGIQQNTFNIDIDRKFKKVLSGLNVAFGGEYRRENYYIFAGDEASWKNYTPDPLYVTKPDGSIDTIVKVGSSQGFPGFRPEQALSETRSVMGAYSDAELKLNQKLLVTGAVRFENYSDFGSTFGGKMAMLWKVNNKIAVRGSVQTGFRAPSLAQVYFRSTINDVDAVGNNFEKIVFNNRSELTRKVGIPTLTAEKSFNTGLGLLFNPSEKLAVSIDAYNINVKDRIVLTGSFYDDDDILGASLQALEVKAAQFYSNALDTKTQGLDVTMTYKTPLSNGNLNIVLSGNFNKMELTDVKTAETLKNKKDKYISLRELQFILTSAPRSKFNLGMNYSLGKWDFTLRNTYFSGVEHIGTNGILGYDEAIDNILKNGDEAAWRKVVAYSYKPRVTTDVHINYAITKKIGFAMGGNNILDVYPTIQNSGTTDGGAMWDAVQMGFQGAYFFTRATVKF